MKQFSFVYFMKNESEKIRQVVPLHIKYWKDLDLNKYSGGPFSDRSGGLITFEAENIEEASKMATNDPFVLKNLIKDKWIKEWIIE